MNDRYSLCGLENERLLASLREIVLRENDALSDMLAHLAELDERGLCLELGYSSLFKYCTLEGRFLQIDHVHPHACGGAATIGNLRLRCRAHNLHAAQVYFGKDFARSRARAA